MARDNVKPVVNIGYNGVNKMKDSLIEAILTSS
jgi:hypothetical protein